MLAALTELYRMGPVGLMYCIKLTWADRQLKRMQDLRQRELALHRQHMAQLDMELEHWADRYMRINMLAGHFVAESHQRSSRSEP